MPLALRLRLTLFGTKMNIRSIIVISIMVAVFGVFLLWLHSVGKITTLGICVIIVTGVFFVGLSHYFYRKFWSDQE